MAKKRQGHYCKICGEIKANEKFSGKGHSTHICKSCASLPVERRNELQRINRVAQLAEKYCLTKEDWDLLEKYEKNGKYPELREFAGDVLELHRRRRESRKPQIEEMPYNEIGGELKEELEEIFYDESLCFITEKNFIPGETHLQEITMKICAIYLNDFHLRIVPDHDWDEKIRQVLKTVIADLKDEGIELPEA